MDLYLTFIIFLFFQNRYGTEAPAENKPNSVKNVEHQEKKMINQEKRPFRIRDKYIDRDSEYLLQENEPDATLDQQLLEDLQKKKTDLRYIEMQVMERKDFYLSSLLTLDKNVFSPVFTLHLNWLPSTWRKNEEGMLQKFLTREHCHRNTDFSSLYPPVVLGATISGIL